MTSGNPARILIVDDHEDNVVLLRIILEAQGYRIVSASDGVEALASIRREPPDLLLLDVMMPRLSGYDVVRTIRTDPLLPYVPIILITAKQELSDKIKGLDIGADDFLPKPVQSMELIAKVRALLRLKQVQDALIAERNKNEMLYLVGQQLNSTLDVDQLVSETLNLMVNLIGATQGSVIIKNPQRNTWRKIMARAPDDISYDTDSSQQIVTQGLAGLALRTRQPQLVTDTLTDPRWFKVYGAPVRVRTALSIPLIRDQVELGVLTLTHSEPDRFGSEQMPTVLAVAAQVISALYNASLYTRLKEADVAREYFVHMLTHDLRGPLSGIFGCLHVLSNTATDPTQIEFIDMALRAAEAQEGLIDDMLDVYRADSGLLELAQIPFTPYELSGPVVDQLAGALAERNLTLTMQLPEAPRLVGDVHKLIRVLINLVNNAIKFTRKGGVTVDAVREAERIVFRVRDTGAGIAPEDVPHVFDRFYQAQQHGARRGTGLGLDFCRVVVKAHGGEIWAESEVGVGTTILFTLPVTGGTYE